MSPTSPRSLPPAIPVLVFGLSGPSRDREPALRVMRHLPNTDGPHPSAIIRTDHLVGSRPTLLVPTKLWPRLEDLQNDPTGEAVPSQLPLVAFFVPLPAGDD